MYQSIISVPKKDLAIFIVMSILTEVLFTIGEVADVFCGIFCHTNKKGISAKERLVAFVIKMMAEGMTLPWKSGLVKGVGFPINYVSRRAYHGANAFATYLHACMLARKGYKVTGEYITLKKCSELGGHVKKGEHGCVVIFPIRWNDTQKRAWNDSIDNGSEDKWHLFFKFYYVFEVSQTTLEPKRKGTEKKNPDIPSIENFITKFFEKTGLKREYNVGTAFYAPLRHTVSVAEKRFYTSSEEYYSTIFHEMVHSTGKAMNRSSNTDFGSHEYSEEEIVAETGAMLLCMHFGIENVTKDNSVAYLQSWSKHLKDNPDWLVKGASQAEKAVAFMLKTVGLDASEFEYQSADTKDSEKASA